MRLPREAGGADTINFINLIWRIFQFVIGIVAIIMYATQPSYVPWQQFEEKFKWGLGIAAGALAAATTPFLAIIPFLLGYRPVAFAFVWDFIVMVVYAATFAYFKKYFPYGETGDAYREVYHRNGHISYGRVDVMRAAVTVDLVGMLLWLITFFMAVGVLVFGRVRRSRVK